MLPSPESDEFKGYGERSIITLADHFYDGNGLEKEKLQGEWGSSKKILFTWKDDIPTSVKENYSHSAAPTARKKTQKTNSSAMVFKKSFQLLVPWKLLQRLFYCFSCSLIG